ncbi:hypothetical protein [Fluviibacterium sp. S390]|uniref:hypothetical protein n=1 Tax=Fluviibacterium sp. S390 TaxID=3415139 RepID=UPI003C7C4F20
MQTTGFGTTLLGAALIAAAPLWATEDLRPTQGEIDAFVLADADRDQSLTQPEFKTFVQAMAQQGQPTARQIRFFGVYGLAFSIADGDKDGRITPDELRQADDRHRAGQ